MSPELQIFIEHPLVPIGGLLLGAVGIVLAVVFYFHNRRTSKLRYDSSGGSLVEGLSSALNGIEVRYKGEQRDRITVTRFVFWNAGTETLRSDDFTDDILRISTKSGINILDCRVIDVTDPTNKISLPGIAESTDEEVFLTISYDYIDTLDGAVVQLVHDGDAKVKFKLSGSLKGNCQLARAESPAFRLKNVLPFVAPLVRSTVFGWFGALIYLGIAITTLIIPFLGKGPWWLWVVSAFCWGGTWIMLYAYAFGQVPTKLQSELVRLPGQDGGGGETNNSQNNN